MWQRKSCLPICENENKYDIWQVYRTMDSKVDSKTENIVYVIQCDKEKVLENKYIGETEKPMHKRLAKHKGYLTRSIQDATGCHFE